MVRETLWRVFMIWIWIVKIDGIKQASGQCDSKDESFSEAGKYFLQYGEEDFSQISLEIKLKEFKE